MPAVSVQCPHCGRSYSVDGSLLGRTGRCKHCGNSFALTASGELAGLASTAGNEPASGPVPSSWSSSIPLPEKIGRFLIKQRLGAGACGTVYRALDPTLDRDVALKVPHPELQRDGKAVERFLREAKAAAKLHHPHIVTVYEAGTDGDTSYIASAFIPGRSLADAIDDGLFEPRRAARIVGALADALHVAHQQGIVHRYVKPANVLLDAEDRPHLTDFGLARLAASSVKLTQVGSILGTPAYLAPEQAKGKSDQADPACDQYSLGVTLYELLCGQVPFAGPLEVVIFNTQHTTPPPLREEHPEIPAELERICLKALSKKPEERYSSCREMAKDLGRWLAGRPTSVEVPVIPAQHAAAVDSAAEAAAPGSAVDSSSTGAPTLAINPAPSDPARPGDRGWAKIIRQRPVPGGLIAAAALLLALLGVFGYMAANRTKPKPAIATATAPTQPSEAKPSGIAEPRNGERPGEPTANAARAEPRPPRTAQSHVEPPSDETKPLPVASTEPPEFITTQAASIKLKRIPPGTFLMGSPHDDRDADNDEKPLHRVRITRPFYLGVYEVNQGQYEAVMGNNPSFFSANGGGKERVAGQSTERHPVENVSWFDAVRFCNKLGGIEGRTPFYEIDGANVRVPDWNRAGYRLPTEAEWEYACRANAPSVTRYSFGDDEASVGEFAWYRSNSGNKTHPVGEKRPSGFGLFDMHGNVHEWCWDGYGAYDEQSPEEDTRGHDRASDRVIRGGCWKDFPPRFVRSARRVRFVPSYRFDVLGFRLALVPDSEIPTPSVGNLANSNREVRSSVDVTSPRPAPPVATATRETKPSTNAPTPPEGPEFITTRVASIKLKQIPPGTFLMGSPDDDKDADNNEKPQHRVRITRPFYLGVYEVTQAQYEAVTGNNPSGFKAKANAKKRGARQSTERHPVEQVSWLDAVKFCNKLGETEGRAALYEIEGESVRVPDWDRAGYRLPTEAEWEYACRANAPSVTRYSFGDDAASLGEFAWYGSNSAGKTHPVGEKRPNGFGLFDMHGNVWEWCWDGYGEGYYKESREDDPRGLDGASARVLRGGGLDREPRFVRSAYRGREVPGFRYGSLGFRLALVQSGR